MAPKFESGSDLRTIWKAKAHAILVACPNLVSPQDAADARVVSGFPAIVGTKSRVPSGYPLANPKGRLTFKCTIAASQPSTQLTIAMQRHGVTGCLDICAAPAIKTGSLMPILEERFRIPLEIRLMTPHRRKTSSDKPLIEAMSKMMDAHDRLTGSQSAK